MKYKKIKIGQRFDLLTVESQLLERKGNSIVWHCKCDCGNYKDVTTSDLNAHRVKSCGCLNSKVKQNNYKNLMGQRFGRLTVLSITEKRTSSRGIIWHCRCDCGKELDVASDRLLLGQQSCGCLQREKIAQLGRERGKDLTGQRFGKLLVLYLLNDTEHRTWHCKCDCGNECDVKAMYLLNRHTSSCGCGVKSIGEKIICNLLTENNLNFISEYSFDDCIFPDTNYKARFDFFVNNKYLIEYDGEQHFKSINNGFFGENPEEEFKKIQEHDKIKNQYCKMKNIPLIRIPYTHLKKIQINDLLLETSEFII